MKAANIIELKEELKQLTNKQLLDICLRLARHKLENKELISYLTLYENDTNNYVEQIKVQIEIGFESINKTNVYFAKKTIRKILRIVNKHIRFISQKQSEAELLIFFCQQLKQSGIDITKSNALNNLYNTQIKKINKAIATLHEDIQYDFKKQINKLL